MSGAAAKKENPDYLPIPVERIPASQVVPIEIYIYMPANDKMLLYKEVNAVLGPVKHARMHEFRDRFFYKREDHPKLEAFLREAPQEEAKPKLTLLQTPHFLSGASTKEELQKRSAELLSSHFGFTYDPQGTGSEVEQLARHIATMTANVLEVLEVDAGVLAKLKAFLSSQEASVWNHSANVAGIAALLALSVGYSDKELLRDVALGGYLHDIGLSTAGLTSRLNESEYSPEELEVFYKHPAAGLELIEVLELPASENVKIIVYQHEEKHDGSGFPMKASGPDIYEPAQIVALATKLDHLIRPTTKGGGTAGAQMSIEEALRKVGEDNSTPNKAVEFNPVLINQIFDALSPK